MSPLSPVWSEAVPGVEAFGVTPARACIRVWIGAGSQVRGLYPGSSPRCVSRRARVSGVGCSAGAWACAAGGVDWAERLGEGGRGAYLSGTHLGAPPWGGVVSWSCSLLKAASVMSSKEKKP